MKRLERGLTALKAERYLLRMLVIWILVPEQRQCPLFPTPPGPEASSSRRLDILFGADDLEVENTAPVQQSTLPVLAPAASDLDSTSAVAPTATAGNLRTEKCPKELFSDSDLS